MAKAATFTPALFSFLEDLRDNNDKAFFDANKHRYEDDVREPARQFIRNLEVPIGKLTPNLRVDDRKVGGSLMRVYRDTRFAKDKTPYKTNVGIQFRHVAGKDVHAPGVYLHMDPDGVFVGVGMWHPESKALAKIREAIDESPEGYLQAINGRAFKNRFEMKGDSLKTAPRGYGKDHPQIELLRKKDHMAVAELDRAAALDPKFEKTVTKLVEVGMPFMRYLCDAVGQPL